MDLRGKKAQLAFSFVPYFAFERLPGIRAIQSCGWFVIIGGFHALFETFHGAAKIRTHFAQFFGSEN